MKTNSFAFLLVLLITATANSLFAQDTTTISDNSIYGQYQDIIQKSKRNDQGFKIVNPTRLSTFQKNFTDTLKQAKRQLGDVQAKLNEQNKTLSLIKAELATEQKNLNESTSRIDEISLLGIGVNKSTYNLIMWGLVLLLGAALAFLFFQSASSRKEARYRTKLFDELSEEFHAFKTKANEKEKKLARELQTERNRVDELLKR